MGTKRFFIVAILAIFSVLIHPVAAESTGNLSVHVIAADGTPLQNHVVTFFKEGVRVSQILTDSDGWAKASDILSGLKGRSISSVLV